jgi:hypothetical protein
VVLLAQLEKSVSQLGTLKPAVNATTYRKTVNKFLAWHDLHTLQTADEIQLFTDLRCITLDAKGKEAACATAAKAEHRDTLALELLWLDRRQKRRKAAI